MATILRRGDRWQARIRRQGSRPRAKSFPSEEAAQAWADRLEARLAKGRRTIAGAVADYLDDPRREVSEERRRVLGWWVQHLGRKQLDRLKRSDFFQARDELLRLRSMRGGTLSVATVNWRMAVISAVLSEEMLRDRIASNPARIPRLEVRNAVDRTLTREEVPRLLGACATSSEPALLPLVVTALSSGCRAGELRALLWRDLDLVAGTARVLRSKSGRPRKVPIVAAVPLLKQRHERLAPASDVHVFAHQDGRAPFRYAESWTDARRAVGLSDVRLHDLRHTFATALAEEGANLLAIAASLGHQDVRTSQRYAHLAEAGVVDLGGRAARRLLDTALGDAAR